MSPSLMELGLPSRAALKARPKEADLPSQKGNAKALSKLLQDVTTMRRARVSVWQRWLADTLAAAEKDAALLLRAGLAQEAKAQLGAGRQPRQAITDRSSSEAEPKSEPAQGRAAACVNEIAVKAGLELFFGLLEQSGELRTRMLKSACGILSALPPLSFFGELASVQLEGIERVCSYLMEVVASQGPGARMAAGLLIELAAARGSLVFTLNLALLFSSHPGLMDAANLKALRRLSSLDGADASVTVEFGPEQRLDMTITERPRPLFLTSLDSLDSSVISQPDTARAVGTVLPCADDMLCLLESHDDDISRAGSLISARELSIPRRLESSLELEAGQTSRATTPEPPQTPQLSRAPSEAPAAGGEALSSRSACAAVLAHVDLLVTRLQATDRKGAATHPPHCVEPGPETLRIIRKILEQFPYTATPQKGTRGGSPADGRARMKAVTDDMARLYVPLALLRLLKVNLDWMAKAGGGEKSGAKAGGEEKQGKGPPRTSLAPSATTESLLATLLGLVEAGPESAGGERMLQVQALAVDALRSGLPIFLPDATARALALAQLLNAQASRLPHATPAEKDLLQFMLADASKPSVLWKTLHPLLGLKPDENRTLGKEPLLTLLDSLLGYSLRYLSACVDAVSRNEPLEAAAEDAASSSDDAVEVEEEEEAWVWGLWHTASVEVTNISLTARKTRNSPEFSTVMGSRGFTAGKHSWDVRVDQHASNMRLGVARGGILLDENLNDSSIDRNTWVYHANGHLLHHGIHHRQILEFDAGDTIRCHLDMDRGTLRFSKNGIEIDKFFTNITGEVFPVASFDHVDDQVTITKRVQIVAESPAVLPLIPSCARIVVETMKLLLTQLKDSPAAQTICCHVAASVLNHVRDALRLLARLEGGPLELLTSLADRSLLRACLPVLLVFLLALSQFCKTGALLPTLAEVAQLLQGLSGQSPGHMTGGSPSAALSLHSSEAPFDPLTQTKLATRLVESPHRYRPGDSPIQDVQSAFVPGADFLLVQFDPRSAMGENDFVKLQQADGATIAGPLMGPAEHRWCVEPILVPGNTVTFVQEMDGGAAAVHGGDWGYKAVVTGYRAPGYSFQIESAESRHPYHEYSDTVTKIHNLSACRLLVSFDTRCQTHPSCSLELLKGNKVVGRYSGESGNWPVTPVTILGSSLTLRFKSGGAEAMWGWKVVVVAVIPALSSHWLFQFKNVATGLCGMLAGKALAGPAFSPKTDPTEPWVRGELLKRGLSRSTPSTYVLKLVEPPPADRPKDAIGLLLAHKTMNSIPNGLLDACDRAAVVCLLYHSGLLDVVAALSRDPLLPVEKNDQLVQSLRVALRLSQELRMELVRRRQVAQLAEEGDVIVTYDSICRPFLDKCRMLLRFDPLCEPGTPRSPSTSGASDRLRKAALKILNKSTKQEAKSQWTSVLQLIKIHSVHFRMEKQARSSMTTVEQAMAEAKAFLYSEVPVAEVELHYRKQELRIGEMETGLQTVLTLLGSSDREVWAGCLDGLASAQQRMQHYLQNVGGGKPGAVSHLRQINNEVLQRLVGFLRSSDTPAILRLHAIDILTTMYDPTDLSFLATIELGEALHKLVLPLAPVSPPADASTDAAWNSVLEAFHTGAMQAWSERSLAPTLSCENAFNEVAAESEESAAKQAMQAVWRLAAALILHLGLYGPSASPRLVSEIVETAHAGALALLTNIRGVATAEKKDPPGGVSPVPVPLTVNLLGPGASNRASTRVTNMGGSGGGMVAGGTGTGIGISSSRALTARRSTRFRTTRTAPAAPAQVLVPSRTTSMEVPLVNRNGDRVLPGTGAGAGRFYCGQSYTEAGGCACGACDGVCGPSEGCPCPACIIYAREQADAALARALQERQSSREGSLSSRTTSMQVVSAPGADGRGDGQLQDRVCIDKVQVSSNPSSAASLLEPGTENYWQSSGPEATHWIRLHVAKGVTLTRLAILADCREVSYCPDNVIVRGASDSTTMHQLADVSLAGLAKRRFEAGGRVIQADLVTQPMEGMRVIQINIKSTIGRGIDTRVHGIRCWGVTAAGPIGDSRATLKSLLSAICASCHPKSVSLRHLYAPKWLSLLLRVVATLQCGDGLRLEGLRLLTVVLGRWDGLGEEDLKRIVDEILQITAENSPEARLLHPINLGADFPGVVSVDTCSLAVRSGLLALLRELLDRPMWAPVIGRALQASIQQLLPPLPGANGSGQPGTYDCVSFWWRTGKESLPADTDRGLVTLYGARAEQELQTLLNAIVVGVRSGTGTPTASRPTSPDQNAQPSYMSTGECRTYSLETFEYPEGLMRLVSEGEEVSCPLSTLFATGQQWHAQSIALLKESLSSVHAPGRRGPHASHAMVHPSPSPGSPPPTTLPVRPHGVLLSALPASAGLVFVRYGTIGDPSRATSWQELPRTDLESTQEVVPEPPAVALPAVLMLGGCVAQANKPPGEIVRPKALAGEQGKEVSWSQVAARLPSIFLEAWVKSAALHSEGFDLGALPLGAHVMRARMMKAFYELLATSTERECLLKDPRVLPILVAAASQLTDVPLELTVDELAAKTLALSLRASPLPNALDEVNRMADDLCDVGFAEDLCKRAVIKAGGNLGEAAQWLTSQGRKEEDQKIGGRRRRSSSSVASPQSGDAELAEWLQDPPAFEKLGALHTHDEEERHARRSSNGSGSESGGVSKGDPKAEKASWVDAAYANKQLAVRDPLQAAVEVAAAEDALFVYYSRLALLRYLEAEPESAGKLTVTELLAVTRPMFFSADSKQRPRVRDLAAAASPKQLTRTLNRLFTAWAQKRGQAFGSLQSLSGDPTLGSSQADATLKELSRVCERSLQKIVESGGVAHAPAVNSVTIESQHPYEAAQRVIRKVRILGAQHLRVTFNSRCNTGADVLAFFKDSASLRRATPPLRVCFKDYNSGKAEGNEPAAPMWSEPLIINGSSFYYKIKTDSRGPKKWGYAFTVEAIGAPTAAAAAQPIKMVTFESLHEYTDNERGLENVTLNGATGLSVHFDGKCSVERNSDELRINGQIFSDWMNGPCWEQELQIPKNTFHLEFVSDDSETAYGYKFVVRPTADESGKGLAGLSEADAAAAGAVHVGYVEWLVTSVLGVISARGVPPGTSSLLEAVVCALPSLPIPCRTRLLRALARTLSEGVNWAEKGDTLAPSEGTQRAVRLMYRAMLKQHEMERKNVGKSRVLFSPYLQALVELCSILEHRNTPLDPKTADGQLGITLASLPRPDWLQSYNRLVELLESMWKMEPLPDWFVAILEGRAGTQALTTQSVEVFFDPTQAGRGCELTDYINGGFKGVLFGGQTTVLCSSEMRHGTGLYSIEFEVVGNDQCLVGVAAYGVDVNTYLGDHGEAWGLFAQTGRMKVKGEWQKHPSLKPFTTGDRIGVHFDSDDGTLRFSKNDEIMAKVFHDIPSGVVFAAGGSVLGAVRIASASHTFAHIAPGGQTAGQSEANSEPGSSGGLRRHRRRGMDPGIEHAARQLAALGYPLAAAEKALAIAGNDVSAAASWLVNNPHVVEEERAREAEGRANSRVPSARYSAGGGVSRDGRPPKAGEGSSSSNSNLLSPLALPPSAAAAASTLRAAAARLSKVAEDIHTHERQRGGSGESRRSLVTPGSGWENEHWSLAMDAQLVLYVCERAALRGVTPMLLKPDDLFGSEGEEDLSESVLARAPSGAPEIADKEVQPGPATTAAATRQVSAESQLMLLSRRSRTALRDRFVVLKMLNRMAKPVLPLIDLRLVGDPASTAHRLATSKGPLFPETKAQMIDRGVALMHEDGDVPSVVVNRAHATAANSKPGPKDGNNSVFGQLFAGLERHSLRRTQAKGTGLVSWLVSFEGEGGTDHGGLFRESLHDACAELQSDALPLFIQCPNGRNNVGFNRDTWVPNPACTSWEHMRRYRFIGTLMGASMRTGSSMELDFSAFVWKQLIGEHPTVRDLAGVDERFVRILEFYRTHADAKAWAQVRQTEGGVKYMVATSDSKTVELIPNGRATAVAFEDRERYCQLALNYRLHEVTLQIAAMREGFCRSGPGLLLPILTWRELERRICGRPEIDVKLLKKKTRYNMPGGEKNKVAIWFWNVMESLTNEDRVKFLSFAWGRGRLPPHSSSLEFTLQLDANRADSHLPQSHTCFFTLDLPNYSSEAVLRAKLLYAVHNCKAIDTDFAASGRLGDDGDPEEDVMSTTDASTYDPSEDLNGFGLSRVGSDAAFEGAFDGDATAAANAAGVGSSEGAAASSGFSAEEEDEAGFDVDMGDDELEEEALFVDEDFEEDLDSDIESDGEIDDTAQDENRYDEEVRRVTGGRSRLSSHS